jgi:hypothetical protein
VLGQRIGHHFVHVHAYAFQRPVSGLSGAFSNPPPVPFVAGTP